VVLPKKPPIAFGLSMARITIEGQLGTPNIDDLSFITSAPVPEASTLRWILFPGGSFMVRNLLRIR
jgi:hypothetical protein